MVASLLQGQCSHHHLRFHGCSLFNKFSRYTVAAEPDANLKPEYFFELVWQNKIVRVPEGLFSEKDRMRVLLVEDTIGLGQAVREQIADDGHAVDWVQRLKDAELSTQSTTYDLMITW